MCATPWHCSHPTSSARQGRRFVCSVPTHVNHSCRPRKQLFSQSFSASMPGQLLFETVGYLAVSPAVHSSKPCTATEKYVKASHATRFWLCASSSVSLKLLRDNGELWLSILSSGVEYVRAVLLKRMQSGTVETPLVQPRVLTPQQTCSCWCLTSTSADVRSHAQGMDPVGQLHQVCDCMGGTVGLLVLQIS